jgi:nitrous oxide reductase accessory protein NosL
MLKLPSIINIVGLLLLFLSLSPSGADAVDTVEGPKTCQSCGMDRTAFAQSRMLIRYADGTTVGVCSLHCAAEEIEHDRAKQVSALMVADYLTKELLDAKTATWVVGGKKNGVMTALAKWAFARAEDAQRFSEENGGRVSSFGQAMNSATQEVMALAAEERAVAREMSREQ